MGELPEHVRRNRQHWDAIAREILAGGERAWADDTPAWGLWQVPESEIGMFPGDLDGKDAIDLDAVLRISRRGSPGVVRASSVSITQSTFATARRLQRLHGLDFPLIHGSAENVPYPDASFDFAISEYGACLWADPQRWIAEAARLLRANGRLVFLVHSFLMMLCIPAEDGVAATERLLRPAFGMYRVEWPGDEGDKFHLSHSDWIRLLHDSGFGIEDLIEIQPPASATTRYSFVTIEWARQWPCEEVWKVRKRA